MEKDLSNIIDYFYEFFSTIYKDRLNKLLLVYPKERSISVDYQLLEKDNPEMADLLFNEPEIVIKAAEEALKRINPRLPSGVGAFEPHVRFSNFSNADRMIETIGSEDLNKLVVFKGVITRRADVMHKVQVAVYRCMACDYEKTVAVTKNFIPPKRCDACKKMTLKPVEEKSKFIDMQRAEIQELLEKVRGGSPAAHIELLFEDDLVNSVNPGDNVVVVGILRLKPPIKSRNKQELIYGRYIEVNNVISLKRDFEEIEISKDEEIRILELSRNPNIEELIINSIAPGIYGHKEVKRALALQLFGGTRGKVMPGGAPIRDDIHILLVGDPGIAKTRFLQSVVELAPKSIYVSGKSVSGVGLTVSAEKDDLGEGGWTLKAGALVLASGGSAAIDEFDKIDEEDRAALHEVMESQTISIAKAGMVARFKAKTAILAAANPKYGRFDQNKILAEQFDIPPSLASRFDLIFAIVDVIDEEKDRRLAEHILTFHQGKPVVNEEEVIDKELLRKYIAYARRNIQPMLTDEAKEKISEFYGELRRMGKDKGVMAITPRYLEGLVRLAEANAKLRLSNTVDIHDAEVAINLFTYMMKQVGMDKDAGVANIDIIATGKSKKQVEKMQKVDTIVGIIKEMMKKYDMAEKKAVIREATRYGIDENTAARILEELQNRGLLYEKEPGFVRYIGDE